MTTQKFITGKALLAGVMGWPIQHSKSPRLHGHWLEQHGIDGVYIPMAVQEKDIEVALRSLPILGFKGVNLTLPHKESAMKFVDVIDPLAALVGAINTIIVKEDGQLEGRNTDVFGFSENLKSAGFELDQSNPVATVLGAGGASRAIIVALQELGFNEIRIVNRNEARAEQLAASLDHHSSFSVFGWDDVNQAQKDASLLVNTTSLGMEGQPDLVLDLSPLMSTAWVTDAVYAPLETSLLRQAKHKGLHAVDGLGMLLHQARPAFAAWFGHDPKVTTELRNIVLGTA